MDYSFFQLWVLFANFSVTRLFDDRTLIELSMPVKRLDSFFESLVPSYFSVKIFSDSSQVIHQVFRFAMVFVLTIPFVCENLLKLSALFLFKFNLLSQSICFSFKVLAFLFCLVSLCLQMVIIPCHFFLLSFKLLLNLSDWLHFSDHSFFLLTDFLKSLVRHLLLMAQMIDVWLQRPYFTDHVLLFAVSIL